MQKPSESAFRHVRIEEGTITDSSRVRWTVRVDTSHTAKSPEDVEVISPYHNYEYGEGIHILPEVGAKCLLLFPSDGSMPRVLGFIGAAAAVQSTDGTPARSTADPNGSMTDVTLRSRRPQMNPGDMGMTTRDGNYFFVRRGGVVQLGAGPLCGRIYLPIRNFIRDLAENYTMDTLGGSIEWLTARDEEDPTGQAATSWTMSLREFAQDEKASVLVRYLPPRASGERTAWEVVVAPQNVDPTTKDYSSEVYTLKILTDGTRSEFVKADYSLTVQGSMSTDVSGDRSASVDGSDTVDARSINYTASQEAVLGGSVVKIGGPSATHPNVYGDVLLRWLSTQVWPVATIGGAMVAQPTPAQIAALSEILSSKVLTE